MAETEGKENPTANGDSGQADDSSKNVTDQELNETNDSELNETNDAELNETNDSELNKVSDELSLTLNADEEGEGEGDVDLVDNEGDELLEDGDEVDEFSLKAILKALRLSTCVKILGLKRSGKPETDYANWCKLFKDEVKVDLPQIQPPGVDDLSVIFKMKSLEDKRKLFEFIKKKKFDGVKLRVKSINLKESKAVKNIGVLTKEEALDILYPNRNKLYADQLKDKFNRVKSAVEDQLLPMKNIQKYAKAKKYLKGIKTKEIKPFSPIDGYENNVIIFIEKNAENGEVVHGLRAVNLDRKSTLIIPLEECLSVPRQMHLVSKTVINGLIGVGVEPYCPATDEGDLLGIALRVTHQGTFMLTVIIKKPIAIDFHELTPEGIILQENETLGTPYRTLIQNKIKDASEKIKKFYEEEGKNLGIQSVYTTLLPVHVMLIQMAPRVWNNLPRPEHVVGEEQLLDRINGVSLKVPWDREKNTEIYNNVLPLFDPFNFNTNTKVYLVSPIKQIGYYFAKKCSHVTQIEPHTADFGAKITPPDGIKNITYVPFNSKLKKPISATNCVVIWWPFVFTNSSRKNNKKSSMLQQFLDFKINTMVFVTYFGKSNEFTQNLQQQMEKVYSRLRISRIIPFDLEPYREGCGLFLLYKGFLDEFSGSTGAVFNSKSLPFSKSKQGAVRGFFTRKPAFGKKTALFSSRFRAERSFRVGGSQNDRGSYDDGTRRHVSVLERLGPRQPDYPTNYQSSVRESPWQQDQPVQKAWSQMQDVVGVVQNLQSMAQQMQAFMNQKQQQPQPPQESSSSWSLKRRYPDDDPYYPEKDSWGSGRPRDTRDSWDSGRGGGGVAGGDSSDYDRWQSRSADNRDSYRYDDYAYSKRRREDFPESRGGDNWDRRAGDRDESEYRIYGERPSTWNKQSSSGGPSGSFYSSAGSRSYY